MEFDLQRARQDTPGCEHVLHFNNAGSSLMPQPVLEATIGHLQLEAQIEGYEAAEQADTLLLISWCLFLARRINKWIEDILVFEEFFRFEETLYLYLGSL